MNVSVEVEGIADLLHRLQRLDAEAQHATGAALYQEGEQIMTRSKTDFVPVDTGTLRGTGHVQEPVTRGSEIVVTMGYGGPAAPYALRQHEDLTFHHPVGSAKYLEKPTLEAISGMGQRIADRIRRMLR